MYSILQKLAGFCPIVYEENTLCIKLSVLANIPACDTSI